MRIPAGEEVTAATLERKFLDEVERSGERLGFDFIPIKRQSLEASAGTTPFDVLFLLLSMFIIAAALMLVWLLFRLKQNQPGRFWKSGRLVKLSSNDSALVTRPQQA